LLLIRKMGRITDCYHHCFTPYEEIRKHRARPQWGLYFERRYDLAFYRSDLNRYFDVGELEVRRCMKGDLLVSVYYPNRRAFVDVPSDFRPLTDHDKGRWNLPNVRNPFLLLWLLAEHNTFRRDPLDMTLHHHRELDNEEFELKTIHALKSMSEAVTGSEEIPDISTEILRNAIRILIRWRECAKPNPYLIPQIPYPLQVRKELEALLESANAYKREWKAREGGTAKVTSTDARWKKEIVERCSSIAREFAKLLENKGIPASSVLE